MKNPVPTIVKISLAAVLSLAAAPARGFDELAGIYVAAPLMVGGTRVEPGSYLIRVVGAGSTHNILQIVDADQYRVLATTIATPREIAADRVPSSSELEFNAASGDRPASLRGWTVANSRYAYDFYSPGAPPELLVASASASPPATLVALSRVTR